MDQLNREYANEVAKQSGNEQNGPPEAKNKNLEKQKAELEEMINQVQKEWIQNQIELLKKQENKDELTN